MYIYVYIFKINIYIYINKMSIYIYMYVYMYVCMYVCVFLEPTSFFFSILTFIIFTN